MITRGLSKIKQSQLAHMIRFKDNLMLTFKSLLSQIVFKNRGSLPKHAIPNVPVYWLNAERESLRKPVHKRGLRKEMAG